jgi:Tfp pilus assembly protein PilF
MTLPRLFFTLAIGTLLSACSLPKVVVLHDPLSADEHVRLGAAFRDQGKHDLARDQFRAAVERDKKHAKAWALLGEAAFFLEELPEAEKAYGRAIDLDKENGDLYNNLAWVLVSRGERLDEAGALVDKAIGATPSHRPYYLDTKGVILLSEGRTAEAVATLEESVQTIPPEQRSFLAEAWLHLAEAYKAAGDSVREKEAREQNKKLTGPPRSGKGPSGQ